VSGANLSLLLSDYGGFPISHSALHARIIHFRFSRSLYRKVLFPSTTSFRIWYLRTLNGKGKDKHGIRLCIFSLSLSVDMQGNTVTSGSAYCPASDSRLALNHILFKRFREMSPSFLDRSFIRVPKKEVLGKVLLATSLGDQRSVPEMPIFRFEAASCQALQAATCSPLMIIHDDPTELIRDY